jgi:hypothetical protein
MPFGHAIKKQEPLKEKIRGSSKELVFNLPYALRTCNKKTLRKKEAYGKAMSRKIPEGDRE